MTLSPPPVVAVESVIGAHAVLLAASELRIIESLAGGLPRTAADIADEHGLDDRATQVVLAALGELGVIHPTEGGYLADRRLPLLVRTMASMFGALPERVRTGRPALSGDRPSEAGRLYGELAGVLGHVFADVAQEVADQIAAPGLRVLDAGAGAAPWSMAIVRREPSCRVDAVDLPEMLPVTRRAVTGAGLGHSFRLAGRNLLEEPPPFSGYDLVLAANLCHLFDQPTAKELIERLAGAARPGATVAIVDSLSDQHSPDRRRYVAVYAAHLLTRTSTGRVHDSGAYTSWLQGAGCADIRRYDCVRFPTSLLTAVKQPMP